MKVRAYTLVELLITLIVIGITMLIIMSGVELVMKYLKQKELEVYSNIDRYNNYMNFLDIVNSADSISFNNNYLRFYGQRASIVKTEHAENKYLIVNNRDTLLDNIHNIKVNADTLSVWLTTRTDSLLRFDYVVGEKSKMVNWDDILEQEQKHNYHD